MRYSSTRRLLKASARRLRTRICIRSKASPTSTTSSWATRTRHHLRAAYSCYRPFARRLGAATSPLECCDPARRDRGELWSQAACASALWCLSSIPYSTAACCGCGLRGPARGGGQRVSRVSSRVYYIVSSQVFVAFDFSGPREPHVPCPCQTDFKHDRKRPDTCGLCVVYNRSTYVCLVLVCALRSRRDVVWSFHFWLRRVK